MRNHDTGDASLLHGLHHFRLGPRVQRACRLIHDHDGGILRQHPGDLQALPLSSGHILSVLVEDVIVSAVPRDDIRMNAGIPRSEDHLEAFDGGVPHLDVRGDGILKQSDLLVHLCHGTGEQIPVDILQLLPVKQDLPTPGLIEAGQELRER